MPRRAQSAAETLAQKAVAAGFPGEQVDGNDVIAVRTVLERALGRARRECLPSLVEALTYRLSDHTTADDARRYRDDAEVSERWKAEPIARMRNFLVERGWWTKGDEERLLQECAAEIDAAVEAYLAVASAPPTDAIDHVFAALPEPMARQRAALVTGEPS